MNLKRYLFSGFLLAIIAIFLIAPIAYAIGNPSYVAVGDVAVFRGLVATGDMLFYCRYNVHYDPIPPEPASDTWLMAIYKPDGSFTGFSRALNYYQENIISIYLTQAQASTLTWGVGYKVRIMGNPGIFPTLTEGTNMKTTTLSSGDYREFGTMGGYLIAQAEILEVDLGLTLLTAGALLNTTGTTMFTDAMPGLTSIIPEIFAVSSSIPQVEAGNYTTAGQTSWLTHRTSGISNFLSSIKYFTGASTDAAGVWVACFICALLGAIIYGGSRNPGWALIGASCCIPFCAYFGLIVVTVWMIIFTLVGIGFGVTFIMAKFS